MNEATRAQIVDLIHAEVWCDKCTEPTTRSYFILVDGKPVRVHRCARHSAPPKA